LRKLVFLIAASLSLAVVGLYAIGRGWFGDVITAGSIEGLARPTAVIEERDRRVRAGVETLDVDSAESILFGDLHVHSGFSLDAYVGSLPMTGAIGGAYTVGDACDFARYCSGLDFWSINDHAINLTPRRWRETIDSIRSCDARAGGGENSDMFSFLGWEWTQMGTTPANHFGHKNVVLRDLDDARIPTRPIAADSPANPFRSRSPLALGALAVLAGGDSAYLDLVATMAEAAAVERCPSDVPVRELPEDCRELVATPAELFDKLDDWGHESLVIPHGNSWGNYTPPGTRFAKQLENGNHDPERQRLVEVYSGHGNAEEHRSYRAGRDARDGTMTCDEPTTEYLPGCWQAGEIIRSRCLADGESEGICEERARTARDYFLEAPGSAGHLAVGGSESGEWLDAGQCRDCFLPAFNHRPGSSVQAILAARSSTAEPEAARFRFGLIGSSDTHTARAGSGYKEFSRLDMTDARMARLARGSGRPDEPLSSAESVDLTGRSPFAAAELDRLGSYFYTGGLVAAHTQNRTRDGVWNALTKRHVYGTSGPRILLYFELLDSQTGEVRARMGDDVSMQSNPRFRVRAAGSFEQMPGCPEDASRGLSSERLERLCRGECANPSDTRRAITRVEIVRIRPQRGPDESLEPLIEDPWKTLPCPGVEDGCVVGFQDETFSDDGRDSVYYVRAIEAPMLAINAGGLRCERDESGACIETRPCDEVDDTDDADDCLEEIEPRAWSSPIFVDHERPGPN
jgi:hypothetical protein